MKIERISKDKPEDLIKKMNEIIDAINAMQPTYITPPGSIYDLNAMGKILKRNGRK
jgi:hypothetical protein